jgi:hypothetical protein
VTADRPAPEAGTTSPTRSYGERLSVPWWWWPAALVVAVLLAAEVHMGYPGVRAWLPYLLLVPLVVAVLIWLGRVRVGVGAEGDPEVRAGVAHLPVRLVGRVDVATGEAKRTALGPDLDPDAFVLHRPWIGPVVRLEVLDPDDPTPYWVVSTRHPQRLLAALGRQEDAV